MNRKNLGNLDLENIQYEIEIHKELKSDHIVKLIDYFTEKNFIYLVLEYCIEGNLYDFLKKKQRVTLKEVKRIFKHIVLGIQYLHSQKVIMRDLKLENCLISGDSIKLCDFGWASKTSNTRYSQE